MCLENINFLIMIQFFFIFFFIINPLFIQNADNSTEYSGLVIKIMDGDTIEVLLADSTSIKVRLNAIDAPEKGMDYSNVSKYYLGKLIFKKHVKIIKHSVDKYKRLVGDVYLDDLYVNSQMLKTGMAWHYKKYSKDETLAEFETIAREHKIGLWSLPCPIEPWEYRKLKKSTLLKP